MASLAADDQTEEQQSEEDEMSQSDEIEVPLTLPKDEADYSSALAQYESDLLEHENRAQSHGSINFFTKV